METCVWRWLPTPRACRACVTGYENTHHTLRLGGEDLLPRPQRHAHRLQVLVRDAIAAARRRRRSPPLEFADVFSPSPASGGTRRRAACLRRRPDAAREPSNVTVRAPALPRSCAPPSEPRKSSLTPFRPFPGGDRIALTTRIARAPPCLVTVGPLARRARRSFFFTAPAPTARGPRRRTTETDFGLALPTPPPVMRDSTDFAATFFFPPWILPPTAGVPLGNRPPALACAGFFLGPPTFTLNLAIARGVRFRMRAHDRMRSQDERPKLLN